MSYPPQKRKKKGFSCHLQSVCCVMGMDFGNGVKEGFGGGMRNKGSGEEAFGVRASME